MVREDFPGGWAGDTSNKFTAAGRTMQENELFDFIKRLAHYRLHSSALSSGRLMQYLPVDGIYAYFRYDDKQTIAIVSNTNDSAKQVDMSRFNERTAGFKNAKNILTGEHILLGQLSVPANTTWVLELEN